MQGGCLLPAWCADTASPRGAEARQHPVLRKGCSLTSVPSLRPPRQDGADEGPGTSSVLQLETVARGHPGCRGSLRQGVPLWACGTCF